MSVHLVHHATNRGHGLPPSSLAGLRHCLDAGAVLVEFDIRPLRDGHYALLHDARLEKQTTGRGLVSQQTELGLEGIELRVNGRPTGEPVALLGQAIDLACGYPSLCELQLDLKADAPLSEASLARLVDLVEPLRPRVRITSTADWVLRALGVLTPGLPLGFDPLAYLDVAKSGTSTFDKPPYRRGAHGYRDDHPMAATAWGSAEGYLLARAETLWAQAPQGAAWYIRGAMLERALDDGYDWIAWLHARGALVDAWTLDAAHPRDVALARRLCDLGVDRITTNDAPALATRLEFLTIY